MLTIPSNKRNVVIALSGIDIVIQLMVEDEFPWSNEFDQKR
jgi:hypothetical protein